MHRVPPSLTRRALVLAALSSPFTALELAAAPAVSRHRPIHDALAAIETQYAGRLGVGVRGTDYDTDLSYRADERFPMCSTFKAVAAAAILKRAEGNDLLDKRIVYDKSDLRPHSPITERHLADGMTVSALCAATLQYSDNAAANLLMEEIGGPAAVTAFARSVGDTMFRLDRWETELNSALPGDPRDTTTPAAMARTLHRIAVGDALSLEPRQKLQEWLLGNTTGTKRIRAGVPASWRVGDKTGTGAYGTTNDIAVVWPAEGPPFTLAVYFRQDKKKASAQEAAVAAATRVVAEAWSESAKRNA